MPSKEFNYSINPSSSSVAEYSYLFDGGIGLFSKDGSNTKLETVLPSNNAPFPAPFA